MNRPFQVNTTKEEDNIIDVPYTEVPEGKAQEPETTTAEAPQEGGPILELDTVDSMVMVGRKKDGEIFFIPFQTNDLLAMDSYVNYARRELDFNFNTHFRIKEIQAQEALRQKQEEEETNGEG